MPGARVQKGSSAVVLAGLVTLTAAAPLLIGGAPPTSQLALGLAALFLGGVAVFERPHRLRLPPLFWFFVAAVVLTALQLRPLPLGLLEILSPEAAVLRREVSGNAWAPITLDVAATRFALLRDCTLLVVFVVAAQAGRSSRRGRAIVASIVVAAIVVAIAALIERAAGTRKIFGLYEFTNWPGSGIWGSFVNGNHAASLFTMGALLAVGAAVELEDWRRPVAVVVTLFLAAMALYTKSRGGAIGLFIGGLLFAMWLMGRRFGRLRGAGLAVVIVLAFAVPSAMMAEGLRQRFTPQNMAELWDNQKTRGWVAGLRAASKFRWTGVGRGAFEAPVAMVRKEDEGVRLVYPENFVVQRAAELGWPATLMLFALAAIGAIRMRPVLAGLSPIFVGAASAIVAIAVHELFDFGTELPGVAIPFVVLLGVIAARVVEQHASSDGPRIPRWLTVAALVLCLVSLLASWRSLHELPDRDFIAVARAVRAAPADTVTLIDEARARHPADGYFELLAAERVLRAKDRHPLPALNRAMRLLPTEPQAHWLAARVLVSEKRLGQAALEYRLAIERGLTPPYTEMLRALGPLVIEAVPQTGAAMEQLARQAIERGHPEMAEALLDRYIELSVASEAPLVLSIQLAMAVHQNELARRYITRLLDSRPSQPESYEQAAQSAAAIGDRGLCDRAITTGVADHPAAVKLLLNGVRMYLRFDEVTKARQLLRGFQSGASTMIDRRDRELLLAEIATRDGMLEEAVAARTRANLIERQLHEPKQ